jgi:NADPH-dependent 2,4-dienoyl-CoA reductase/sulfur reductase-like enzyme
MQFNRRRFLQAFGAAAASSILPTRAAAASAPKVVIIGGGFGGATAAKYLRTWSDHGIDVTLIDQRPHHYSCVMSNLILNRKLRLADLKMTFGSLADFYGVKLVHDSVTKIDPAARSVQLKSGAAVGYDRLIIATGIAFDNRWGADYRLTPHAWIAGGQTNNLAAKVNNHLGDGSTFVMTGPKAPYRCPPGPYERACLVADILKRKGLGGKSRVVVLDENAKIMAEEHTFSKAYDQLYGDIVEYIPNATIDRVDSTSRTVFSSAGDFSGDVVNVIPRQRAHGFIRKAGLADSSGWAMVDPVTYESTVAPGVHVIGDAQNTGQPKSAHMANSQAKVCADAIIRSLDGKSNYDQERLANLTTNSACYSPVTIDQASWLTANFAYDPAAGAMRLTHIGEADRWSRESYEQMFAWASNLFTDSFH